MDDEILGSVIAALLFIVYAGGFLLLHIRIPPSLYTWLVLGGVLLAISVAWQYSRYKVVTPILLATVVVGSAQILAIYYGNVETGYYSVYIGWPVNYIVFSLGTLVYLVYLGWPIVLFATGIISGVERWFRLRAKSENNI